MLSIEVTYTHSDGGWYARSADMLHQCDHVLAVGEDTYAKTRATVEEIVPWTLEREDVEIQHCIAESALSAYLAERDAAAKQQTAA